MTPAELDDDYYGEDRREERLEELTREYNRRCATATISPVNRETRA